MSKRLADDERIIFAGILTLAVSVSLFVTAMIFVLVVTAVRYFS